MRKLYDSGVIADVVIIVVVVLIVVVVIMFPGLDNVEHADHTASFAFPGRLSTFNVGISSASNSVRQDYKNGRKFLGMSRPTGGDHKFTTLNSKTKGVSSWAWRAWLAEHRDRRARPPL